MGESPEIPLTDELEPPMTPVTDESKSPAIPVTDGLKSPVKPIANESVRREVVGEIELEVVPVVEMGWLQLDKLDKPHLHRPKLSQTYNQITSHITYGNSQGEH